MDIKTDYQFEEGLDVTPEVQRSFDEKGYVTVRSLLNDAEMLKLRKAIEHNKGILKHHFNVGDGHGRNLGHVMWSHPGNDITGMIARSEKVGGFMGKLLGGEVYHYHSKMIMKSAKTGGRFNWHQDYGYWYNYCLYPDMGSVFIAFDKCDRENGCLQIIPGSHKMGRVDHVKIQDQTGADVKRVEFAQQKLGLLHVELDAGDALFFHSNVLHSSSPNNSDRRRWSFIMCYNRKDNDPIKVHHHPSYTPMQIVPNSAIMDCSDEVDLTGKDFLNPREHEAVPFQEDENGETKAKKPKRR